MILSGRPSSDVNAPLLAILVLLCLALVTQGAHVCSPVALPAEGAGATISLSPTLCPVCAVAHTLLITLIFILFSLVPTRSRTLLLSPLPRLFRRHLRLDLRAPPALSSSLRFGL